MGASSKGSGQGKASSHCRHTDTELVVDVLCATLPRWNFWGRIEAKDKQALIEIARNEKVRDAFNSRIVSALTGPMAAILSQTGCAEILDCHLEEIARTATQPSVRAKAYRCLLEGKIVWSIGTECKVKVQMVWSVGPACGWTTVRCNEGRRKPTLRERDLAVVPDFVETLKLAIIDRSPMVRRLAVEMLVREPEKVGDEILKLAGVLASDATPSVAERGRFALERALKSTLP